jgi:hypothetical protein
VSDREVPDLLVSESMVRRFIEIEPPMAAVIPDFQRIVNEIERSYVLGSFFSALSSACVSSERLLNLTRIKLHPHLPKIKKLWNKGALDSWEPNINALEYWGYVDATLASELRAVYREIRCPYLHSGDITNLEADAVRTVKASYKLLSTMLGFPSDLFRIAGEIQCLNENDPRFVELYRPHLSKEEV